MIILKPHDVVVALQVGCLEISRSAGMSGYTPAQNMSDFSYLTETLAISKGEMSKSLQRLKNLELIRIHADGQNHRYFLLRDRLLGFLLHGIRHVFQPEYSGLARGIPSGWNCPHIESEIVPSDIPLVWAASGGEVVGEAIEPLYKGVPQAIRNNKLLHILLALVDIIRKGKPRELVVAKRLMTFYLQESVS